jgi:hypothetical protein
LLRMTCFWRKCGSKYSSNPDFDSVFLSSTTVSSIIGLITESPREIWQQVDVGNCNSK